MAEPVTLQELSGATLVILVLLRGAPADGVTRREIELEARYLGIDAGQPALDQCFRRLLNAGLVSCVGYHRTGSSWVAQRYALTPAGEDAAEARLAILRGLLSAPRVFLGSLAQYDAQGTFTRERFEGLLDTGGFTPLPVKGG